MCERVVASLRRWLPIAVLLVTACATSKPAQPPSREAATVEVHEAAPTQGPALYPADEALRDALSGELKYLGTGHWPGVERSEACAFRNDRVVVVIAYCTVTETPAFRVDVYSPERGRVRVYAEANGPVSARQRDDYFIFTAESEPPPGPEAHAPALTLAMSFQDLRSYDKQRYDAFLPGCYGGERHAEKIGGCLGALAPEAGEWAARNRDFLEHANADWYRAVREMRALAARHGKDPK